VKGKLMWQGEGKSRRRRIVWQTKKGGMTIPSLFSPAELDPALRDLTENEIEVELELEGGQPRRIRPAGLQWAVPSTTTQNKERELPREFHNPYNFIPALPRTTEHLKQTDLGDYEPKGHDRYHLDCYSGRLRIKLRVHTPLLVLDTAEVRIHDEHKTYPVGVGNDGHPHIAPTSLKGMLRSAFEAVTNSRLSNFASHENRLAYRMQPKPGLNPARVEPARVEPGANGALYLRIMKSKFPSHPAKLLRYEVGKEVGRDKGESKVALKYKDSEELPQHGDAVWVRVDAKGIVTYIEKRNSEATEQKSESLKKGWVCETGPNINGKRYERVFLESDNDRKIKIEEKHKKLWEDLIRNYQTTHLSELGTREKEKKLPQDYLGDDPGRTGWSRHIYEPDAKKLETGTLCYVEFKEPNNNRSEITALLPVTISRRLFDVSPSDLLDRSLKPAVSLKELSPADRVFGWVNQKGNGAHRGQIRIGQVRSLAKDLKDVIERFIKPEEQDDSGLPLAILGQPKPQQARFYVAKDETGRAQQDHLPQNATAYTGEKRLRGRKVYPHHNNLPEDYWEKPLKDRTQEIKSSPFFQEYRRPQKEGTEQRDSQNRSIEGWIKPRAEFEFDIHITNLSAVELGALVWLLSLPQNHYHRLGGGKPLGFGSVWLDLIEEHSDVRSGKEWQEHYLSLEDYPVTCDLRGFVTIYRKAVERAYGRSMNFEDVPFIKAFCRAAKGYEDGLPIHYPRIRERGYRDYPPPKPDGESFQWFVENNRSSERSYALRDIAYDQDDPGLPILEEKQLQNEAKRSRNSKSPNYALGRSPRGRRNKPSPRF
jgi:CRISPR-associated protein (TIGR03986 family)